MDNIIKFKEVQKNEFNGSTLINKGQDFKLGSGNGTILNNSHQLMLSNDRLEGSYMSPEYATNNFKNIVASWNAESPEGTEIEVLIQVKVADNWSKWFSYGKWSQKRNRGSINGQRDEIAFMDIDTLIVLNGNELDGFKYKIKMTRDDLNIEGPRVKAISATLSLSNNLQFKLKENSNWLIELDVPKRSQMSVPKIGNIICSPTSLAMVMEYYGTKIDTEEVAINVRDNGAEIYGNWSYNVAYAGAMGFSAHVARLTSVEEIKDKISKRIPVVASIRTKEKDELMGSPMAYPGGHLIVVKGFKVIDGVEHIIVNDPAAPNSDTVHRNYKLSDFEKAWSNIVYILTPDSR